MTSFNCRGSIVLSFVVAALLNTLLVILAVSRVESQVLDIAFWPGESVAKLIFSGFHSLIPLLTAVAVNCICYTLFFFFIIKLIGAVRDN